MIEDAGLACGVDEATDSKTRRNAVTEAPPEAEQERDIRDGSGAHARATFPSIESRVRHVERGITGPRTRKRIAQAELNDRCEGGLQLDGNDDGILDQSRAVAGAN